MIFESQGQQISRLKTEINRWIQKVARNVISL